MISFALLLLLFTKQIVAQSNITDQLALLNFKNQIANDVVLANNWTMNTSFCSWIGIRCSSQRQRVVSLNLSDMNFVGTLSPSISNLSFLTNLDLSNNNFHGSLPFEITRLPRLRIIDVASNHLTGSIPSSFFNMSSLRSLDLSNNSFSGSFMINNGLPHDLEVIDLSSNNLTGEIPSGLCRFTNLKSLDFSLNNLTGRIPRNIGCLSNLERLYMTGNNIVGTIPSSIGNMSSLEYLGCVENSISGNIPREIGRLSNLRMLGFDYNDLTGEIPVNIFNLSSLVYIAFTENSLTGYLPSTVGLWLPNLQGIFLADNLLEGEIPISITNASMLSELELSYNHFTGMVPNNLGSLRDLVFLNLAGNQLTNEPGNRELGFMNSLVECRMLEFLIVGNNQLNGILPDSVQNLSSSIQMFNIENGRVYGRIPRGIGNMSSLISLVLNGNDLTGNLPLEIGYLTRLQRLFLNRNELEGNIPVELCSLVELGDVILSENNFSGSIPDCIGDLVRLQRLLLGSNKLESRLPSSLWRIRGMLLINVTQNLFQGELPSEIAMLEGMEGLDLSSNQFSGSIPSTIGELTSLRYLYLSNNSFDGSIPVSFGNMISLEILDMSSNNLSGTIPMSLERLTYLRSINLSYNHLEGQMPSRGVFANSSLESFRGNKALCGMPSIGVPICATRKDRPTRSIILKICIPIVASLAILILLSLSFWCYCTRRRVKLEDNEGQETKAHQMITYRELLTTTDNFSEENLIGVGSSGSVFKSILFDGTIVAVKVLNLNDEKACKRFDAECEILKQIRHRNLVKVITTCSNDYIRAFVLQYMPNGSLETWLYKRNNVLNLCQRVEIMIDVGMAIEYLHHDYDHRIVHCDLKPENVLLDADMVAHVSDFGISKILSHDSGTAQTKTLGTIGYIAPEYGSEGIVSTSGDVYSFGIMLIEVMTKRRPTDDIFSENLSMKEWARAACPKSLVDIVDADLLREGDRELNSQDENCIASVIELALDCSKEAYVERINMKEAVFRLIGIKKMFLEAKEVIKVK